MGSCVSSSVVNKSSDSVVKLAAFISLPSDSASPLHSHLITSSTINAIHSGLLDSSGDKEEEIIFFDSRGWLDSDCEDDFLSVDGDFTPSQGTTPLHHKFCDPSLQGEDKEKHSPTDNKKRLVELFKEEEDYVAEGKSISAFLWLRTPVRSSAPVVPYNYNKQRQLNFFKRVISAAQGGCVPSLVSCGSFTHGRQNMTVTHAPTHLTSDPKQ